MMCYAVGHGLDEYALFTLHGAPAGFAYGQEYGERVVTVDADGIKAVAGTARRYPVASVLIDDRCRNCESDTSSAAA